MIGNGETGINSFGSNITLDTFNNRVFDHQVFGVAKRFAIANSGTVDIVINPIEKGVFPKDTFVFLPIKISTFGAGPIEIDIYAGTDNDADGTEILSLDRNFDNPVTAHTTWRLNPTINDPGTKTPIEYDSFSLNGQGVSNDVGGNVETVLLFVPTKTVAYMLRLVNTDTTNSARGQISANWFEV